MEVGMSLNALVRLPLSNSRINEDGLVKHSLFSSGRTTQKPQLRQKHILVVQAKGKKGMQARQFQRSPPPPLPKIEDDGNPKFVIFIRMATVCSLYLSLSLNYYFDWFLRILWEAESFNLGLVWLCLLMVGKADIVRDIEFLFFAHWYARQSGSFSFGVPNWMKFYIQTLIYFPFFEQPNGALLLSSVLPAFLCLWCMFIRHLINLKDSLMVL